MNIVIETKDDKYVAGVYADEGENTENDTIIDCAVNGLLAIIRFIFLKTKPLRWKTRRMLCLTYAMKLRKSFWKRLKRRTQPDEFYYQSLGVLLDQHRR